MPTTIVKRDGRIVPFDVGRIENALTRCFASFQREPGTPVAELALRVVNIIAAKSEGQAPSVEGVQDIVEMVLQAAGEFEAAKRYILYRAEHAKRREERPVPAEVRAAFDESARYFPTPLQQFQFFDKYSRFSYELGRRETWVETVDRAVDFLHELAGSRLPRETYARVRRSILEMRSMPSMRLLAMAGPAARRSNITIYNCSYQPVESIDSFCEALMISMSGCGVGFSVESQYVENFPRIRRQRGLPPETVVVEDSAEGWAEALRAGLEAWFDGGDVHFDLSLLRLAGAPLRTKGGRASGPEPLRQTLRFVRSRLLARQGSFLRPLDAHDIMCAVGNAAVSGGMRRTAMISLFDYDDEEMRLCKSGDFETNNSQRWNANNSAVWPAAGLTQREFVRHFMEMVESERGEPGIFNRQAAMDLRPARRAPADFGTNPSMPAGTLVGTRQGIFPIEELEDLEFEVKSLDGTWAKARCFLSGDDEEILKIDLGGGKVTHSTRQHRWPVLRGDQIVKVYADELKVGDLIPLNRNEPTGMTGDESLTEDEGFFVGYMLGDGWVTRRANGDLAGGLVFGAGERALADRVLTFINSRKARPSSVTERKSGELYIQFTDQAFLGTLVERYNLGDKRSGIPTVVWTSNDRFVRGFVDGLFSSDASVSTEHYPRLHFVSSRQSIAEDVVKLLSFYGVPSSLTRQENQEARFPNGKSYGHGYDRWNVRISHGALAAFANVFSLSHKDKAARLGTALEALPRPFKRAGYAQVKGVALAGRGRVWDISVEHDQHVFPSQYCYTGNCGEIVLRPWQFCNLSIAVARPEDTFETLRDKVEVATIIGTIQSLATHFPGLRSVWRENCEEERLLGVDITGQMDSPVAQQAMVKARLREVAVEANRQTAALLGINRSAATTCVKPSGNSSQLLDCSSGLHARWAPHYIRNVRVATHSPMFKVLRDAAVPMDPENGQTPEDANTWVIHFPVKAPTGAVTRTDRSAVQQCEFWLQNKVHWTEHNPSVTITYRPDEVIELMKWVWEHRDLIGGMAFLPAFDAQYAQLPYIEITREEYEKLAAAFPEIDFSKIYRYEEDDRTNAAQELACSAGVCEVEF